MEHDLILKRRKEVEKQLARLRSECDVLESELAELDTAEKVILRLGGGKRSAPREANKPQSAKSSGAGAKAPPASEMIMEVLKSAYERHGIVDGLAPKDIAQRIQDKYKVALKGEYVSTSVWRLWKKGDLLKDESGRYRIPISAEVHADTISDLDDLVG